MCADIVLGWLLIVQLPASNCISVRIEIIVFATAIILCLAECMLPSLICNLCENKTQLALNKKQKGKIKRQRVLQKRQMGKSERQLPSLFVQG